MSTTIELKSISKYFGSVIALKDISISVNSGEVLCLLGDNGAGKSTLIKTLAGVHQPDEGDMFLEGKKILFDSPRDALDRGIATVYQDLALVPLMSVDFPAPLSPKRQRTSPELTEMEISLRAITEPKYLLMLFSSMVVVISVPQSLSFG